MTTPRKRFSIGKFLFLVAAQFSLLLLGIRLLFPKLWALQTDFGFVSFLLTFLCMHLFFCFFEWGFHRYVLHVALLPWLSFFARQHTHHHNLTDIKAKNDTAGQGRIVLNEYPIEKEEQYESSAFPDYALSGFWLFFTPLFIGLQLCLPNAPILLGGYAALTFSMICYEVFHAIEHMPFHWWKRAIKLPRTGKIWEKIYAFHHFHHFNRNTNEAISGFFGLPVADWVLRTYHLPKHLLLLGYRATTQDIRVKPLLPIVRWMDSKSRYLQNWTRNRAQK